MTTITFEELQERLVEVFDQIAHGGEAIAVTRDGIAVAELTPTAPTILKESSPIDEPLRRTQEEVDAYMAQWRQLAEDIAPLWPTGVSAVDAVREDRSRLDAIGGRRRSP